MKLTVAVVSAVLALTACASGTQKPIALIEIERMQPDCSNADIQIRYLNQQLELGNFNQLRSEYDRRYVAKAKEMIWELRSSCWASLSSFK